MSRIDADRTGRRVLFIQANEPAAYPPLVHASWLMAEAKWNVSFLSAPIAGMTLKLNPHPRIAVHAVSARTSHVMGRSAYARYAVSAAVLALRVRPEVVYASDPLGAAPGLLAARLVGANLIYHEHDSPDVGSLHPWLAHLRAAALRSANLVIFPNNERARIVETQLGLEPSRTRIVWNLPCRVELPQLVKISQPPLILYYHGSVTPDRLPESVVEAVRRFRGGVRLRVAGYEAAGATGYIARLVALGRAPNGETLVDYAGQFPQIGDLLTQATYAHVGLALMPPSSDDLNMRNMTGASNKPFDYMAAGLALLVSDLPDWRAMFVAPGFARTCNPTDADSICAALTWFLDHAEERRTMGARARAKIEAQWNYDTAFAPVLAEIPENVSDARSAPRPKAVTCEKYE